MNKFSKVSPNTRHKLKTKRGKKQDSDSDSESTGEMLQMTHVRRSSKNIKDSGVALEEASSSDSGSAPEEASSKYVTAKSSKSGRKSIHNEIDSEEGEDSDEESSSIEEDDSSNEEEEEHEEEDDEKDEDIKEGGDELDADKSVNAEEETVETKNSDEFAKLRKELSNMPFDELQRLKEKIGIKMYNQVMFGKSVSGGQRRFKRENKNRPMEVSSKIRPRKLRQVVGVKKRMVRDPRFDDLSGSYREDIFKKTFSFLDDIKKNEKQKVKVQLKKERNDERKQELEYLYKRLSAQEQAEKQKEKHIERDQLRRRQERTLLAEGKKPFFLKNSDKKKLELAEKYRELKRKGKLDQYLSKKRKKNASKEKRKLPSSSLS